MGSDDGEDGDVSSLATIAGGASMFTVGKLFYNGAELLLNITLTRTLGVDLYGVYAYTSTILTAALVLTNGGTDKSVLKYLPEYEDRPRTRRFMLGLAFLTSLAGGGLIAVSLAVFAPVISRYTLESGLFVDTLRIFALIVLFDTMAKITNSTFRAVEFVEYEILLNRFVRPVLRLGAVVVALYLGASFVDVMAALLLASAVTLVASVWLFLTRLDVRPTLGGPAANRSNVGAYYGYSLPLVAKNGASLLRSRVDVLMVGFFLTSSAVGIYNVAILVASLVQLPLLAVNRLFPPVASRLHSNDRRTELDAVYSTVTRWVFTLTLFLTLGGVVYRAQILQLFGTEFTAGALVLVLFVVGQLVNASAGPAGFLLMMTEHQYVVLWNQWAFGALNVALNYLLILELGLIGAAVASAGMLAALNVARLVEIWYYERLFPYTWDFLKPLGAAVPTLVAMYLVETTIAGIPGMVLGGGIGGLIYAGSLFGLGIDEGDRELLT